MNVGFPSLRPVSLPHQGGDTVQGESSALRRKPDPNRPWGIKPEMGLVPCQVADSNPVLGKPTASSGLSNSVQQTPLVQL